MTVIKLATYTEYQKHIKTIVRFNSNRVVSNGDIIDDTELKTEMLIDGAHGKKLKASDNVKQGAKVYEYITAKDKAKGTVSRYALIADIIAKEIARNYSKELVDITNRFMRGELSAEDMQKATEDVQTRMTTALASK